MKTFGIYENEEVCVNCSHFHQHYVQRGQIYIPCFAGHCSYPRIKNRTPGTESCIHFKQICEEL